jgi:D-amino-acid dehydrogenase
LPLVLDEPWSGLRPCTPDGLPVISIVPKVGNLIVASGHAMLGMSLGPITGKLVAQLASGEKTGLDVSKLKISRFD